ncbi:MAG TPA: hypothetical protein VN607_00735 [Gemmatimonadaceae bacterium]|nr:hypothetical protein [Gemmatimonadaceae bacterium]
MAKVESVSKPRTYAWWIATAVCLAAGYADLVRGGTTLAPILLVIGYCVLIPLAILIK